MKKIGLLCLAIVLALGALGVGYAAWTDTIYIDGTVTTGVAKICIDETKPITQLDTGLDHHAVTTCEPFSIDYAGQGDDPKDVGNTTVTRLDCDTLEVIVNNAYPCYYNHIDFWVVNRGTIPLKIWKAVISDGDDEEYTFYGRYGVVPGACLELGAGEEEGPDLAIHWGNSWGTQIHPGDQLDMSFDFHVLQPIPQDDTFSFTITLYAIQWDEYVKGPLL